MTPPRVGAATAAQKARQSGGSKASIWPLAASSASISASGVAGRAVSTSSAGS